MKRLKSKVGNGFQKYNKEDKTKISWSNPLIVILWVFGWAAFSLIIILINHTKKQIITILT